MATASDRPGDTTVHRAKLIEWNAERGFGFADDGRRRVFIHVREFIQRPAELNVGATVTFVLGADAQGRPCGQRVALVGGSGSLRRGDLLVLLALLVVPALAVYRLLPPEFARGVGYVSALVSIFTFVAYYEDKRRAKNGDWRTPEGVLHLLELCGGWPGAYLGQRWFRHKSSKLSFRVPFWLIVALYQVVALDALLGWLMLSRVRL